MGTGMPTQDAAPPEAAQQALSPTDPRGAQYAMPIWIAPDPGGSTLTHRNAAGNQLIKTGPGWISVMSINTSAVGTLTIYDGIDASGAVLGVIDTSKNTTNSALMPWPFQVGLFIAQVGTADITLITH
jgi:hypothetical protein